jgi:16S rRNA (adenine1518-N6/adenine1519-N6)-dimethyltransferase
MAEYPRRSPKKSLGQNFLVSESVAARIVTAVSPAAGDLVFEIGPGRGALTLPLADTNCRIVAYEIDRALVEELRERCAEFRHVDIRRADIREIDFDIEASAINKKRYKIVGNIPYNLTSTILLDLPGWRGCTDAVVMIQREVADRVLAAPGERNCGILTVFLQSYLAISKVARVRPGAFIPPPKVESIVVKLVPKTADAGPADRKNFLRFLKTAFSHRRKKLKTVFRDTAGMQDAGLLDDLALQSGVNLDRRAEELELDMWFRLYRGYEKLNAH